MIQVGRPAGILVPEPGPTLSLHGVVFDIFVSALPCTPKGRHAVYNLLKNPSSIARRADSRVTQAACMATAIDPWILSS